MFIINTDNIKNKQSIKFYEHYLQSFINTFTIIKDDTNRIYLYKKLIKDFITIFNYDIRYLNETQYDEDGKNINNNINFNLFYKLLKYIIEFEKTYNNIDILNAICIYFTKVVIDLLLPIYEDITNIELYDNILINKDQLFYLIIKCSTLNNTFPDIITNILSLYNPHIMDYYTQLLHNYFIISSNTIKKYYKQYYKQYKKIKM